MRKYKVHRTEKSDVTVKADRWEIGSVFVTFPVESKDESGRKHLKFVDAFRIGSVERIEEVEDDA